MIDLFFQMTLNNVCISFVIAIMAVIVGITLKRPSITYLLWLLVFVKLLTPPVVRVPVIPVSWMDNTISQVNLTNTNKQQTMQIVQVSGSEENEFISARNEAIVFIQGKQGLFLVWLSGSMMVFLWSLIRIFRFNRLLKKESKKGTHEIQTIAEEIASRLRIKAVPTIYTTSANLSPMVWWIGGEVWVVIPVSLIERLDTAQLRWVLSHELAHVRRRDYMIRWIEWLACVCFWWNPVTWWARYNLRANEELCCDALVISSMSPKPYVYGDSLLKAIEILASPLCHPPMVTSGINGGELLKRRVKMIISKELNRSNLRWLKACILLGALVVLPLGLTSAKGPGTVDTISNESTVPDLYKSLPQEVTTKLEEQRKFPGLLLSEIHRLIKIDDLTLLKQSGNHMTIKGVARSNSFDWDQIKNTFPLFHQIEWRYDPIGQEMNQEVIDYEINATLGYYNDEPLEVIPKEVLPKFLTEKRDIPSLLRQISASLVDTGTNIYSFRPNEIIKKDGYSESPIHMVVTGEYRDIMTSFEALSRMDRFVTLRDIEIHPVEDGATIMKTSMTVVTYHL